MFTSQVRWSRVPVFLLMAAIVLALSAAAAPAACAGVERSKAGTSTTWYLAEGSTGQDETGNFETFVLVANPGGGEARVRLWHQLETPNPATGGDWPGAEFTLAARSRATINVADTVDDGVSGPLNIWSISTRVESDEPVVAERAMYWTSTEVATRTGITRQAAHESVGVTAPADTWYLAEGSTHMGAIGSFETWVLIQNPGPGVAEVDLQYQTTVGGGARARTCSLPPRTRRTVSIADALPGVDSVSTKVVSDVPVIAERAMYWSTPSVYRLSAHDSTGVTGSAKLWYLPAGRTGAVVMEELYETFILVQNPGGEPATVTVSFIDETPRAEPRPGATFVVEPRSRYTVDAREYFPEDVSGPVWFASIVSSDVPVIAEKAVYYTYSMRYLISQIDRGCALGSPGIPGSKSDRWFFAEGSTGSGSAGSFETDIAVANPTASAVDVDISYQTPAGEVTGPSFELAPYTLRMVSVSDTLPGEWSVSTTVESVGLIAAERVMQWTSTGNTSLYPEVKVGRWAATSSVGIPED